MRRTQYPPLGQKLSTENDDTPWRGSRMTVAAHARASWGAALRTGAAGSQDESRCSAIHKQRPYPVKR
jgi:hypothetical protein